MPYAQIHYPFEHKAELDNRTVYPADFIAEGVASDPRLVLYAACHLYDGIRQCGL